jgi:hypothetical protein
VALISKAARREVIAHRRIRQPSPRRLYATGFVRIIPPQSNVSGLDVAAAIVGNDAKECKGKFASARNSELIDGGLSFGVCHLAKTKRDQ